MASIERRFAIVTYGCQMNVHDSDKLANLLQHSGFERAEAQDDADLLVVNTCSIRDKAEQHLYSDLGQLRAWKDERPGRLIGVGGCVAQQVGDAILRRFPQVDFVFGTHNLRWVPAMVAGADAGRRSANVAETSSLERFDLPERHPDFRETSPGRAFLTAMEGCDMFCSFCIVPRTRGREISRPADAILAEAEALAARGVHEITVLGQTVNAYGRHDLRRAAAAGREPEVGTIPFAELLRRLDAIPGIDRIRYTSPHPIFFDDELIRAHGELESLCPHVHLPLQSGSDAMLARMRRRYDGERFLGIAEALRAARPDIAITTDLIVGHPGESDDDFRQTLAVMEAVRFVDAFSFKYSPRPGTAAAADATGQGAVPPALAQARLEELQALQRGHTLAYHRSRVGSRTEILVEGEARRAGQRRGRDPFLRVVNFEPVAGLACAPGDRIEVEVVEATPHSLIGVPTAAEAAALPPEFRGEGVKVGPRSADEAGRNAMSGARPTDPLRVLP